MKRLLTLSLVVLAASACSLQPATPPREEATARALESARAEAAAAAKAAAPAAAYGTADSPAGPRTGRVHPRPLPPAMRVPPPEARERYQPLQTNPVRLAREHPVSTFSVDVDTGSYANVRRMLVGGQLPPRDAVRVEEMINYFPYDYAGPRDGHPFAVHVARVASPWREGAQLLRIAIKGEDRARAQLPPSNLVFLVDVSGSMGSPDKLPLLKSSLKLLAARLRPQDRLSLVTYASGTELVLPATPGSDKARIVDAIDALRAGGATAGASGIELAYRTARAAYIDGGINRILLATDGDFNVGVTDFGRLKAMVEDRRRSGIALSTLGFGRGNYNEHLMEQLADAGDGAYAYIDSLMEGHKVLVEQASSTLETIARDVKVQIEFNPARVSEYRLIGYENRLLAREDFNNDKVDAGEIGAGHSVTVLYEITPAGAPGRIDPLRYGSREAPAAATGDELGFVKLRYKRPGARDSVPISRALTAGAARRLDAADADTRFAVAVAGFGELLRGGQHTGGWDWQAVRTLAQGARGEDAFGYRGEFLRLVDLAAAIDTPARPRGED
ncbi:vWA domain-containing protein [Thauera phenolivorans]|uniref:vWA domain-containing protein n=1 Tax=Thauera phenolivorans TaxID=1792543 RepID=UPI0009F18E7E|nr:von Willebrand factor type A domain-containing protein [Thauera phenolivorans]